MTGATDGEVVAAFVGNAVGGGENGAGVGGEVPTGANDGADVAASVGLGVANELIDRLKWARA